MINTTPNKQKGDEYEIFIAEHYRQLGYIVIKNGMIAEKDDKGVDLIAIRLLSIEMVGSRHLKANNTRIDYVMILIQCKRFESKNQKSVIVDTKEKAQKNKQGQHSIEEIFNKMNFFIDNNYIVQNPIAHIEVFKHLIVPNKKCLDKECFKYVKNIRNERNHKIEIKKDDKKKEYE